MDKTQLNSLPDLPELENVEANQRSNFLLAAFLVAMVGMIVLPTFGYWHLLGKSLLPVAICCILLQAPVLYIVYGACTRGYYWKTDAQGITERSLFRRRRIEWTDVQTVESSRLPFLTDTHRIFSRTASVTVLAGARQGNLDILEASVWQHLRTVGKADDFALRGGPVTLWDAIPDAALEKAEVNQRVPDEAYVWPVCYVMFVGLIFYASSNDRACWPWVGLISLLGLGFMMRYAAKSAPARHYVLTPEHLEVLGKRPRKTAWQDLTAESGMASGYYGPVVRVCTADYRVDLLTPLLGNAELQRAKLALIRHVREAGRAVMVPEALRVPVPRVMKVPEEVDGRLPGVFVWFTPVVFSLLAIVGSTMPKNRPYEAGDAVFPYVIAALGWLIGLAACRLSIRADGHGISKTTLLGTRSACWEQVVSYERNLRPSKRDKPQNIALKDAEGHQLIRLSQGSTAGQSWELLVAYLDSKLPHLLPPPEEQPSWLARPFKAVSSTGSSTS